jgi:hypothetical protein
MRAGVELASGLAALEAIHRFRCAARLSPEPLRWHAVCDEADRAVGRHELGVFSRVLPTDQRGAAIVAAVEIPFLHIADATADAIAEAGISTVGLLATAYTMEQGFYVGRLRERHGLDVLVPNEKDRRSVHDVIYDELCVGIVNDRGASQLVPATTTRPRGC